MRWIIFVKSELNAAHNIWNSCLEILIWNAINLRQLERLMEFVKLYNEQDTVKLGNEN